MGKKAKFFKLLLQIMTFDCLFMGTTSSKKKKIFPHRKGKPSKNITEEKIVVKTSERTNQIDVDQVTEIHLPEEIIVDILIRLPVQSLVRFKCASKFWNTLFSDPYFKAKHYNHAKNNKKILIAKLLPEVHSISCYCSSLSSAQPLQKLPCPSYHKQGDCSILCCCDGLALLWCRGDYLLWNPPTNESVQPPSLEIPPISSSTYGMGYNSISDDYKILMIDNIKVLALKSGSWRKIDNHPRGFRNSVRSSSCLAYVRGAFHWICKDKLSKYFLISFNISNEGYGEISLPEEICNISNRIFMRRGVSVLEGMLCAYCSYRDSGAGTFKLWIMKDYGVKEFWVELFSIPETNLFLVIPKYMFGDGEVLLYYQEGLYCEFRTSKGPYELLPSNSTLLQGFIYTESLISPKLVT